MRSCERCDRCGFILISLAETGFLIPTLTSILYALERVSYAIVDRNRG